MQIENELKRPGLAGGEPVYVTVIKMQDGWREIGAKVLMGDEWGRNEMGADRADVRFTSSSATTAPCSVV